MKKFYKNSPLSYLSHIFGHESDNSILALLIKEGLAFELSSGSSDLLHLFSYFEINIILTKKGLANYEKVVMIVLQYLKILREKGAQEWIFHEIQLMHRLKFDFLDKEKGDSYVVTLNKRMQDYPLEHILIAPYLNENFEE